MALDQKIIIERLAFIKYIFRTGLEESCYGYPLCSKAILTFHDSVELFLILVVEHYDKARRDISIMEYWNFLEHDLPLSGKASIKRLNKLRVSLKHSGIHPPEHEIEDVKPMVNNFFFENSQLAFNLNFEDISLINLVHCDKCKDSLQKAKDFMDNGEIVESLKNIAIAFVYLIDDINTKYWNKFGYLPSPLGDDITFLKSSIFGMEHLYRADGEMYSNSRELVNEIKKHFNAITNSIESLQNALHVISLGIDYHKYIRFESYTPSVFLSLNKTPNALIPEKWEKEENVPSEENTKFCFDFVIECALKIQQYLSNL